MHIFYITKTESRQNEREIQRDKERGKKEERLREANKDKEKGR